MIRNGWGVRRVKKVQKSLRACVERKDLAKTIKDME